MKTITLLKDNVLIRLIHEEASAGGIILSNAHHVTKPHRVGTVLAVGPKADMVKPDDRVILGFGGHYTKWNGDDDVVAVKQEDILGVIDSTMSKTLIGITSYGGLPFLKLALRSIEETTLAPVVVVVIVAKPGDTETLDFVRSRGLLAMPHEINRGFPASCNDLFDIAFTQGCLDNLIIMGNDVVAMPGAIDALINCADTTDYDMICGSEFDSRFLVNNYPEARQFFHGPNNEFTDFTARPWELHKDFREGIEPGALKDVQNFTLYKRRVFDTVGYVDVNFWPNGYFSDNDLALRCNRAGIRACGLKQAAFFHFWSRTIHQGEARPNNVFFERNRDYYVQKWGGEWLHETKTPELRIASRDGEAEIIRYWSSL